MKKYFLLAFALCLFSKVNGESLEEIPFGNMDKWLTREVKESFVIGGNVKTLHEIAAPRTLEQNRPYKAISSPWATSSVYAKVSGITKGSITVFPEPRDGGNAARLETCLEKVKVFGVINISALATGSIFLGEMVEPISDTKNPQAKLNTGIPFTKRPTALVFDYKVEPASKRIYDNGFKSYDVEGENGAEAVILLQQRWEDSEGRLFAKRVATGWHRFYNDVKEWQNGYHVELEYGDISQNGNFESYKGLMNNDPIYGKNSKGIQTKIEEVGWAPKDAVPTHIIVRFSSGYGGAYIGSIGSKFWIDNVKLAY